MRAGGPVLLLAAVLTSACGSGAADTARHAAEEFETAAATGSDHACALLTDRAREDVDCTALGVPTGAVVDVAVWGDAALVRTTGDTLFLRELNTGWRVAAAGCRPVPDRPYECEVGGP
ncbi:hypothetical protein [Saccharothrix obliqua]|uniref:hypothetical protein n=1 Tax=Saccharothrix obliqua TaxID=2861747 RepID=UPI001C601FAB|nr:hypothetical protein [Saccharothrix obliqua]MBW4722470.1 hypothetical protein [Saccharothrix obliqua]